LRNWTKSISNVEVEDHEIFEGQRLLEINDEQKPVFLKKSTPQQIQANISWHERIRKILGWFFMTIQFHNCAYLKCKFTQTSLGHTSEDV
jgi:hypothetical protein